MKLVVEITDYNGAYSIEPFFKADREDNYVRNNLSQAEEVARLTEVSQEIERTVNAYYSKDKGLMPIVSKKSSTEPLTV